ncbi:MAG: hypothetical protein U0T82_01845 [Bacteroidales bacterium]
MKYPKLILPLLFAGILFTSCTKDDDKSDFSDGLTFGLSVNYSDFTLSGEGTSFDKGNVAYRLESEEDFNSNPVKFVIKKDGVAYSTEIFSSNPTPTGHIFMTTFNYNLSGQYSVTAYIEKPGGDKTVASGSFQIY